MKYVIRAGGIGTRLWPLSRISNPKQFQTVVGSATMLRTTYDRIKPILKSPEDVFCSVNIRFADRLLTELPELAPKNRIIETETRNTGPAMCLEVCYLAEVLDRGEIIASIPSDDYIADSKALRELLQMSEQFIKSHDNYLVTPAVVPAYPDTGYSYFKAGANLLQSGEEGIFEIDDVIEKPESDYLRDLLKTGQYYAHTGMYIWRLGRVMDLFEEYQSTMMQTCRELAKIMHHDPFDERIKSRYAQLEKMTIETALTEHVDTLAMSVSNRIGWSDLGKWHIVKRMLESDPSFNVTQGLVIERDSRNNLIYTTGSKKVVVVNGVEDSVIVDTGDALFVSSLENSADIKSILDEMREKGLEEYL